MKKTINGKSYNTNYDSEFVTSYTSVIDSWCRTKYYVYRKKSTGEYFEYKKPNSWGEYEEITILDSERADKIIRMTKKGYNYYYTAYMLGCRSLRKGYCMWGTKDEDPWEKKSKKKC